MHSAFIHYKMILTKSLSLLLRQAAAAKYIHYTLQDAKFYYERKVMLLFLALSALGVPEALKS